tara:strand:- start:2418 stop:2702 length:285 start_codon:yes stop_codon:yes gene_type:complete
MVKNPYKKLYYENLSRALDEIEKDNRGSSKKTQEQRRGCNCNLSFSSFDFAKGALRKARQFLLLFWSGKFLPCKFICFIRKLIKKLWRIKNKPN